MHEFSLWKLKDEKFDSSSSATPIEPWRLAMTLLGPAVFLGFSYYLELGLNKKLILAIVRSSVQLLFLGYVLLNYIFSLQSIPIIFLYLFCMILIAALELTGRQVRTYKGHFTDALLGCLCGGGLVGLYANLVIFHPTPWYKPEVMIPTAGMIIGNSVSGPAQTVDRLLSEVCEKQHEVETRLCFGATAYEAVLPKMRTALQAALLPTLNQFAIMGLVSIPGMMTGQLLGGTKPLVAAQYQMAILYLILTTTVISSVLALLLAVRHAVFDLKAHRVAAPERVFQRAGGKLEVDLALYNVSVWIYTVTNTSCFWLKSQFSILLPSQSPGTRRNTSTAVGYAPVSSIELSETSLGGESTGNHQEQLDLENQPTSSHIHTSDAAALGRVTYTIESNRSSAAGKEEVSLVLTGMNIKPTADSSAQGRRDLEAEIKAGVTMEGVSGIGKTRLLRAMAQLDALPQGQMRFSEVPVENVPLWRKHVIYVPQALPPMSGSPRDFVEECGRYVARRHDEGMAYILHDLVGQLERVEQSLLLRKGILSSPWASLSGGERQRALVAAAVLLATSTVHHVVLLLDEPTAACDASTTLAVEAALRASGATILMTTHDERQAARIAHRRLLFHAVSS
eukprot:gene25627-30949_t